MTTPASSLILPSSIESQQPPASDLFALTDEQILEIKPEGDSPAASSIESGAETEIRPEAGPTQSNGGLIPAAEPPRWLADMMSDTLAGGEARDLWNGVQQARSEAAAYREVFSKPEEARAAAERARALEEIDSAFFGGAGKSAQEVSAGRAALAQRMLREDPAAFREMVFAGLRALESGTRSTTPENGAAPFRPPGAGTEQTDRQKAAATTAQDAHFAEYRAFEKSANDDLERSVGSAIQRALEQALPSMGNRDNATAVGARHASSVPGQRLVPLQQRLGAAVRDEVEAALKSDQQLGEQVSRVLSTGRFDETTRTQVVRLINDRAQQLVPGAARRVIQDWTQTAFAAQRNRGFDVAPAFSPAASADGRSASSRPAAPTSSAKAAAADRAEKSAGLTPRSSAQPSGRAVDYHRLTDEQILDL